MARGRQAFTVNGVPNMIPAGAINPVSQNLLTAAQRKSEERRSQSGPHQ